MRIEVIKQNWCEAQGLNHEYLVLINKKARYKGNKSQIEAFIQGVCGGK